MRDRLEYLMVAAVAGALRLVPRRVGLAVGTLLGITFYALDRPHRRLTQANLAAAFPGRPASERRQIARSVFGHFGRVLVVLIQFSRLSPERMRSLIDVEGEDRMRQAQARGKGVLIFSGHFGFWEIHGIGHGLVVEPMSIVARALDNPYLHDLLERIRTCTGNSVIYRRGGLRRIMRALASNQTVGMLIDQHIHGGDAVYVEFFNRPAATTSALAALALRTGAPIIPVFALPLPGGRFKMVYERPVDPPAPDAPDPIRELTQRCTDVLEMYVRRYPELWLWMHRRWRDVDASGAGGMFPAAAQNEEALPLED